MKLSEYFKESGRTRSGQVDIIRHAVIGMGTEAGELLDAYKKHFAYGLPLDITNVKEEIGDIFWYISLAFSACKNAESFIRSYSRSLSISKAVDPKFMFTYFCDVFYDTGLLANDAMNDKFVLGRNMRILIEDILLLCAALNISAEECLDINIAKLKKRYKGEWTVAEAVTRDLASERKILEGVERIGIKTIKIIS